MPLLKLRMSFLLSSLLTLLSFIVLCNTLAYSEQEEATTTNDPLQFLLENPEGNCTPAAIFEFPSDGLTREDRRNGWVSIHFFLAFYSIILLSTVCDDYFVPAIQSLVIDLDIPEDIAGASFMAITSASPELFVNFVGTFITQGDIGVGTVVGSNVFNVLAVPACCLFSNLTFKLDWYSMTRDCLVYGISVLLLITTLWDDKVQWYEALTFVLVYLLYILVMYHNKKMQRFIKRKRKITSPKTEEEVDLRIAETSVKVTEEVELNDSNKVKLTITEEVNIRENFATNNHVMDSTKPEPDDDLEPHITEYNSTNNKNFITIFWKFFTFPITTVFEWTIPDCKKEPRAYIYSLIMCMVWIGVGSYLLTWFITVIGDTLSIPDSVVGLSFVAVGSSIPEVVSCIIISRQGQGAMGISSALGANTFEILLCLGLPWLLKTVIYPKTSGSHWLLINSSGLAYNAGSLFSTLIFLYICLLCNRFRLDWKLGITCLIAYIVFLVVGTLIELNYFFPVNLPTCDIPDLS